MTVIRWQDISPADAVNIDLRERNDIIGPLNEEGETCPWPWEPQQRQRPAGTNGLYYSCPHCKATVIAGAEHVDYAYCPEGRYDTPEQRKAGAVITSELR